MDVVRESSEAPSFSCLDRQIHRYCDIFYGFDNTGDPPSCLFSLAAHTFKSSLCIPQELCRMQKKDTAVWRMRLEV